jgi:hypothetical protein
MIFPFILLGFFVVLYSGRFFEIKKGDDWFVLYATAVMLTFATFAFVRRRRIHEPMYEGELGNFEPTIARMIEILVYCVASYIVYGFLLQHVIGFMPKWGLGRAMWSSVAIFIGISFFCWTYSQNLSGYKKEIALSAAVGSLVQLAIQAVDYVGSRYQQDWIFAGGFYLLTPIVLAFIAARMFADRRLDPYLDASADEWAALHRLRVLALVERGSWKVFMERSRRAFHLGE